MKEFLELEIRRKIFQLIEKNPGLHARRIAERLSIQGQLADYHLLYLERKELVTTIKEEGYRRYYIKGELGTKDRRRLGLLRQDVPLKIVLFLLKYPNAKHNEIRERIGIVKSTLTYHLQKLLKQGIISEHLFGKDKRYRVVNEREITELLIRYKPYSRLASFEDMWKDLKWPGDSKK
jgi:predicted transcriptional regulator